MKQELAGRNILKQKRGGGRGKGDTDSDPSPGEVGNYTLKPRKLKKKDSGPNGKEESWGKKEEGKREGAILSGG